MSKRDRIRPRRTRAAKQQSGGSRWRTYSLMTVCGVTLLGGLFLAARQHFASMDTGMRNSRLRKQVDELLAEKRRLLLAREVSLSPAEIKKAARKTGLLDTTQTDGAIAQIASSTKEKVVPPGVSATKSMIVKTAAVSAVQTAATVSYRKMPKVEKPAKPSLRAE